MSKSLGLIYLSDYFVLDDSTLKVLFDYFEVDNCVMFSASSRILLIESHKFHESQHGHPIKYYHLQSLEPVLLSEGKYSSHGTFFNINGDTL